MNPPPTTAAVAPVTTSPSDSFFLFEWERALAAVVRAMRNFCGNSRFPASSVYRLYRWMRTPCLTSASPRSCKAVSHVLTCSSTSATVFEIRMCPASPQSITRCAMLMPPPATFARGVDVLDAIHRAGVNSHAQLHLRPPPQDAVQFQSAARGSFHVAEKDQGHAVAGGQSNQLVAGLGPREFLGFADRFLQMM